MERRRLGAVFQTANVALCVGHLPDVLVLSLVWKNIYKGVRASRGDYAQVGSEERAGAAGGDGSSSSTPTVIKTDDDE